MFVFWGKGRQARGASPEPYGGCPVEVFTGHRKSGPTLPGSALDSTLAGAYPLRGRWHRGVANLNFIARALVKPFSGGRPDASFEQSLRDFERAIALESNPYNHLELAKTSLEIGRKDDARAELRRALELEGSPFDAEHKREAGALLTQLR